MGPLPDIALKRNTPVPLRPLLLRGERASDPAEGWLRGLGSQHRSGIHPTTIQ
jgi:hypothetical protein